MNIRDLKYLIAVAETNHFGKAAERCYVSQPTLSGQIKKLEEELGVTLFERTKRSVSITPVGEEIVSLSKKLMEQADAIVQLAKAHNNPLAGALRIGVIHTISPYLMPLVLMPLKLAHPELRPVLTEEVTANLMTMLHQHQLDAAIIATDEEGDEYETIRLFEEPFWLAHPSKHPIYTSDTISCRDIGDLDLLLLTEDHCLARQIMALLPPQGDRRSEEMADLRAASLETLLYLVGAGYGSTLVPALAVRGSWTTDMGVIARQIDCKRARRTVRLIFRKTFPRKAALEALVEVIQGCLPNTVKVI